MDRHHGIRSRQADLHREVAWLDRATVVGLGVGRMIPVPETLTEGTDTHRLFLALRSGQPKSHHELYGLSMIVHSRASDLRLKHGCLIDTWRDGKTTWYQLRAVRENGNATT